MHAIFYYHFLCVLTKTKLVQQIAQKLCQTLLLGDIFRQNLFNSLTPIMSQGHASQLAIYNYGVVHSLEYKICDPTSVLQVNLETCNARLIIITIIIISLALHVPKFTCEHSAVRACPRRCSMRRVLLTKRDAICYM